MAKKTGGIVVTGEAGGKTVGPLEILAQRIATLEQDYYSRLCDAVQAVNAGLKKTLTDLATRVAVLEAQMMATMARIVALESRPAAQRLTGKFIVGDKVRAATGNMAGRELIVAEVTPATSPPGAPPAWQLRFDGYGGWHPESRFELMDANKPLPLMGQV